MAITYCEHGNIITIHTEHSTYQMKVDRHGVLLHLYYGEKMEGDASHLLQYLDRGFSGNPAEVRDNRRYSLDALPQEYPTLGTGDYRNTALNIRNSDGSESCQLKYKGHRVISEKYGLKGLPAVHADRDAQTLEITLEDTVSHMEVKLLYGVLEKEDMITRSAVITNLGDRSITIEKAGSACLDFLYGEYDLIRFHGKHALERLFERSPIGHSSQVIGSRRGTSSHQYNPGVILADREATETKGNCFGMLFVYSGNFRFEAERDQFGLTRAIMGLQSDLFRYKLEPGETFFVPETILTFSCQGFSKLSENYHRCIRNHICRGRYQTEIRPVLVNSWEAAYFDFDGDTILQLAKNAAQVGIDMVVMDDGWFGKRDDDNSGLGDWTVNEEKLGCSLGELIQKVNAVGVKFGIWIEPEMVSEDSRLYREHPDWAIKIPGRAPIKSRNQLVLDYSRAEVRDSIFQMICSVLDQGNIEYIKWDMNRSISDIFSLDKPEGNVSYDYCLGVYDFLEKLSARYPNILIEGCSGGGGRFDAGMLYYTPQIWCSDNTDAINRLMIQYGTSFFYPISSMGSHVSAAPNHQTGRKVSMQTRNVVAMAGTFGYELDLGKLSPQEKEEVRRQVASYKKYAHLIQTGNYYRLSSPFEEEYTAWQFVSEDQSQTLFNLVRTASFANPDVTYCRLRGLDAEKVYEEETTGEIYPGSLLMEAGLSLPTKMGEYPAFQMAFREKKGICPAQLPIADGVFDRLKMILSDYADKNPYERVVLSVYGGSGSGKTGLASLLTTYFKRAGIGICSISGDDYPLRIPKENDAMREKVYREEGEEGLRSYLGSPKELDFEELNQVIVSFKGGAKSLNLRKMGRGEGEIWHERVDTSKTRILLVEWTHGNSPYLTGVDIPIFLESTPEETLSRREKRGRDANVGSPFTSLVLAIEQEQINRQREKAKIVVMRDGSNMMKSLAMNQKENVSLCGPMLNAYPDSVGGNLDRMAELLSEEPLRGTFDSFYILPSLYHSDLDRGFSVIDYGINEEIASAAALERLKKEGISLKLDFVLNHLSIGSPQFQDLLQRGKKSEYADFFIDWNRFWEGKGEMTKEGYIMPEAQYLGKMFFRKPGLPILMVPMPDGEEVPYWNTFYQKITWDGEKKSFLGQMDLNIKSPLVWEYYDKTLEIIAGYGAKIVRLDAFAYAPKEPGEKNFLNEPGTWELLEKVQHMADRYQLTLLPEIHAAFEEKIYEVLAKKGYMVYDFFLPGLIIDAIESKSANVLLGWGRELLHKKIRTVNMLGCHDGIPLLDLKGLLSEERIQELIDILVSRGGYVKNLHGQKNMYYQVNATYYSALGEDDKKMLLARALQIFMPGIPQVWYLDLFALPNDYAAVEKAGPDGHKEINRTNLTEEEAREKLKSPLMREQIRLLRLRRSHKAFALGAVISMEGEGKKLSIRWEKDGESVELQADLETLEYKIKY